MLFVVIWITLNTGGWFGKWDRYPFDTLKWILIVESSFATSMLLMSQTRQDQKYRNVIVQDYILECKMNEELKKISLIVEAKSKE